MSARLTLHVQPRAARSAVAGPHGDAIKVRLAAPPVDGAANAELLRFLAERLGVRRAAVRLVAGAAGRRKVVEIDGGQRVRSHLNTLGLHVGDEVVVVDRAPFRGPVLIEIHGTRLALGRGVASRVRVELGGESRRLSD